MAKGRIADLHAALTWDLADFERGTAKIELSFNALLDKGRELANRFLNIGRDMTRGLTVPIAGVATAIGAMAKATSEDLKQISTSARLAGEDVERFQRQAYAANEEVGIQTEKLGEIFADSREKVGEFAATGGGEMADFFENVAARTGLTVDAFQNLSGKDGLQLVYNSLLEAGAGMQEIEFYLESMASDARLLIPLLAENGKGFEELGAKANVFTPDQIASLLEYRQSLRDIGHAMDRVVIAAVDSGLIDMFTRIAETIADWITRLADTNPALLRFAGGVAVALAALGPMIVAMQALAVVILPLFLARLGPIFAALSFLINPIGTVAVLLTKLAGEFITVQGGITGVLRFLGRLAIGFARLNPVVSALSILFLLFRDNVLEALGNVWDRAQEVLGPAFERLLEAVSRGVEAVQDAFASLANSPLGQFLGEIIELLGQLVGALIEIAGGAVIVALNFVIGQITAIAEAVAGAVRVVTLLLQGDWAGAWQAAKDTVANMIAAMLPSFQSLFDWIHDALALLGILEERQKAATDTGSVAVDAPEPDTGFLGAVAETPKVKEVRGAKGPSAEDLADRRAELDLEHKLALAREARDYAAIRALEEQRDLRRMIERYEDAGLDAAAARAQAEADLAELAKARQDALQEELKDDVLRHQLQEARIRDDAFAIRTIEEELFLKEEIAKLEREGYDRAVAQEVVERRLLGLQQARADAIAERAKEAELDRQIELSRARGDDPVQIAALEDEARYRARVRELVNEYEVSLQEAHRIAQQEASDLSRAHLQGNIRDAMRGGLQAAFDGNLKDYVKNWFEDAGFNALSRVLDRLADRLGDLLSGTNGGGGLFGAIGRLVGGGGVLGDALPTGGILGGGTGDVFDFKIPGFNNGGSMKLGGLAGIDRNLLSLNGRPIARVGRGETLDITPANGNAPGGKSVLQVGLKDGLRAELLNEAAGQTVQIFDALAPGFAQSTSNVTRRDAARSIMPGGSTG